MTFAVFAAGGKQYIAEKGKKIKIEKIVHPGKKGAIEFDTVLIAGDEKSVIVGNPSISGAKITAEIAAEGRHPKVTVVRYKSKTRYHKKKGHKQHYTEILIKDIKVK